MNERTRSLVDAAPGIVAVATLGVVALLAILGFGTLVPVAAVVGWLLLTPLSAILGDVVLSADEEDAEVKPTAATASSASTVSADDPVERLRQRYADGDIDEDEFERRLDLLLDTEGTDIETARDRLRSRDAGSGRDRELDVER